jgi:excisionase family DNA binding protein
MQRPVHSESASPPEPFITISEAATRLKIPVFKLRRAARAGQIPTYRIGNLRRLVRLSEIVAAIERSRQGGRP